MVAIKYDSAVHAKRIETTLRGLENKAKVYYLRVPRAAVFVLAVALLAPWVIVVALSMRPTANAGATAVTPPIQPMRSDRRSCKPGPWGTIEYFEIVTQPPDELISPDFFATDEPQWVFKGYTEAALDEFLAKVAVPQAQRIAIASSTVASNDRCVTKPSDTLILELSPTVRGAIYAVLARFPENAVQRDPFLFPAPKINEWLDTGSLSADTVAMVKKLLYPHGDYLLFSDCHTVVSRLPDVNERMRLLRILFRRSAVLTRLRIGADDDIKALTAYWGKGGREMVVRPLLESIPRTTDGITVGITLLLPPFARARLYTYPMPGGPQSKRHDCHWTAMNFFNDPPDERFVDANAIVSAIGKDYYPLPGPPALGDLVLFSAPDQTIVHSAIYVADDIVFTKNGPHFTSPWLLMTEAEVMASFPAYDKLNVTYHRLKKL